MLCCCCASLIIITFPRLLFSRRARVSGTMRVSGRLVKGLSFPPAESPEAQQNSGPHERAATRVVARDSTRTLNQAWAPNIEELLSLTEEIQCVGPQLASEK